MKCMWQVYERRRMLCGDFDKKQFDVTMSRLNRGQSRHFQPDVTSHLLEITSYAIVIFLGHIYVQIKGPLR